MLLSNPEFVTGKIINSVPLDALANALRELPSELRVQTILDAVERRRTSLPSGREIARFVEDITTLDHALPAALLSAMRAPDNGFTQWLRAELLAASGNMEAAAEDFASIVDDGTNETRCQRLVAQARCLSRTIAADRSVPLLRDAAKIARSQYGIREIDKLLRRLRKSKALTARRTCRLALLGSATLSLYEPALRVSCFAHGIDLELFVGEFDQYQQEIINPDSALARFRPDVVVLATDWRSLHLPEEAEKPELLVAQTMERLRKLWGRCREQHNAFVIQHNFEVPATDPYGRMSNVLSGGRASVIRDLNSALWRSEQSETGLAILDVDQTAALHGKIEWDDAILWHSARQYPSPRAIPLLAHQHATLLRAILGLTSKCLVLDLDNTLWGGIVGEDGVENLELGGSPRGEAFVSFQNYLVALRRRGVIIAVCSKNNEEDAKAPFLRHPEMMLSLDDIALFVANWKSKDENIQEIAKTLNIGLDAMVFIDDNPMERAWIRRRLPDVEVPEMPADPALYITHLHRGGYFEGLALTAEDRQRTDLYRENADRRAVAENATNLDEFLQNLQMCIELFPFDKSNLPRIVQLINKTNQFNLTTRRATERQIQALTEREDCYTQAMRVRDRFGDNGLTGVLFAYEEGQDLRIDTWLISCRVLGRKVEDVMLRSVISYATQRGLRRVIGDYLPTSKNHQVGEIYDRFGFTRLEDLEGGGHRYYWPVGVKEFPTPLAVTINDRTVTGNRVET